MLKQIVGWDLGGAHVKVAALDNLGRTTRIGLYPCPLWQGLEHLQSTLRRAQKDLQLHNRLHIVTMTGELADIFASRDAGVEQMLTNTARILGEQLWIFAGLRGFIPFADRSSVNTLDIASMNWLASAAVATKHINQGLFIDIGSTTTDILLLQDSGVKMQGMTDYHRLISSELVYTGIVRTAVMAVAQQAEFKGQKMGLMAEYFATMADVYRLTEDLHEAHDCYATADGGPKTQQASALRLSRMTGYEFNEQEWPIWLDFAQTLKRTQKNTILSACLRQLKRLPQTSDITLVGAGIGRFLVKEIADELNVNYLDFNDCMPQRLITAEFDAAACAPAVAVARLFFEEHCQKLYR